MNTREPKTCPVNPVDPSHCPCWWNPKVQECCMCGATWRGKVGLTAPGLGGAKRSSRLHRLLTPPKGALGQLAAKHIGQ